MNRDLSLRAILSEWVREVVGLEGRLPRTLAKLFSDPGYLARASVDGERDAYLSALKLYLVANVLVFLVGPCIGAFGYTLAGFVDELSAYRGFVEREQLHLAMSAAAYEARFNVTIAQHAPTLIFLVIPAMAGITKALLPRRMFGEHLIHATDFVAWTILTLVLGVVFMRVMGLLLGPVLNDPTVSWAASLAVVGALTGLAGWYLSRSLRAVFGLRGAGLRTRTVLLALALVGLLVGYSHLLFWSAALTVRLA